MYFQDGSGGPCQDILSGPRDVPNRELRNGDICVIPTVVHVIHTGEAVGSGSNISEWYSYKC